MTPAVPPTPERPARSRWRAVVAGAAGLALLPGLVVAGAAPAQAASRTADSDITFIATNLRSPQSYQSFQKDAAEVFSHQPDLVAYNEVAFRYDGFLAPEGYQLWRKPGQYTGATPVAWRTDTWSLVASGTRQISFYKKRPPGKQTKLGLRFANWVTLQAAGGRTLSVVAIHVAPVFRDDTGRERDLLRPSVRRLSALVEELGVHGPVLVGGDFNVHYKSRRYPRGILTGAGLAPTYDLMGSYFPTGDHGGHTVDYVFVRGSDELEVDDHYPVELRSDHDAVVAGLSWTSPGPGVEVVSNNPRGDRAEQRAVANRLTRAINAATAGERVEVSTRGLTLRPVYRSLKRAYMRGVAVHLTTLSPRLTRRERWLRDLYDGSVDSVVQRCRGECARAWVAEHRPSELTFWDVEGEPVLRIEVSRRLRKPVISHRTRAIVRAGDAS